MQITEANIEALIEQAADHQQAAEELAEAAEQVADAGQLWIDARSEDPKDPEAVRDAREELENAIEDYESKLAAFVFGEGK